MSVEELKELAMQLAKRCRWVIQTCLREEEWSDADEEFTAIILEGLQERERKTNNADR